MGEYVDAPMLRMRLRSGKSLAARVHGSYGVYATTASIGRNLTGSCTCPADDRPCKHIEALRRTYRANRASFTDLDSILGDLLRLTKGEIVEVVRDMAMRSPEALAALGVEGFDDDGTDDGEDEDDEWPDEGPVTSVRASKKR